MKKLECNLGEIENIKLKAITEFRANTHKLKQKIKLKILSFIPKRVKMCSQKCFKKIRYRSGNMMKKLFLHGKYLRI